MKVKIVIKNNLKKTKLIYNDSNQPKTIDACIKLVNGCVVEFKNLSK